MYSGQQPAKDSGRKKTENSSVRGIQGTISSSKRREQYVIEDGIQVGVGGTLVHCIHVKRKSMGEQRVVKQLEETNALIEKSRVRRFLSPGLQIVHNSGKKSTIGV